MIPSKNTLETDSLDQKTEVRCLEPLLQKSLKNNELQVVNFSATKLLPPGENYASIVLKIDVKIRKDKSAKEELLHLVAKTSNSSENLIVNWPLLFNKEIFMYAEVCPLYKQLERDAGIEECELLDIWPKYIGHRNSLNDGDEVDNDSLMLMENINCKGFYTLDRRVGLDMHHARMALTSLARYHALGIVMQEKQPAFAKRAIDESRVLGIDFAILDVAYGNLLKTFRENVSLQKHISVIESSFDRITRGKTLMIEPTKPWATITHGDFWTNNILFHRDEKGNVEDVKFVDFQNYSYHSPLKDVLHFLVGSLDRSSTNINCYDELISLYYDTFIKTLKRMNYDCSQFTSKSLMLELKEQAINDFPHSTLSIRVFDFEYGGDNVNYRGIYSALNAEVDERYINKLKTLLEIYEKMGWF